MGEQNLTRDAALARSARLSDVSYGVALDLSGAPAGDPLFLSASQVEFSYRPPMEPDGSIADVPGELWVDLLAESLDAATLNGQDLPVGDYDGARLPLPAHLLSSRNTLVVRASCRYMRSGEGLHRFQDAQDGTTYLYTQMAVADARRVFACFDQPDLKASVTWSITTPSQWLVVANSPARPPSAAGPGTARWDFPPTAILPTYVMAFVAGPYAQITDTYHGPYGSLPLAVYCRAAMIEHLDVAEVLEITKSTLRFYERSFAAAYPFAKYDQVFVPEFNFGAMENPGVVMFREDTFVFRGGATIAQREQRAIVIAHEMAHMWFGDLVTMRWWDDIWLNESFAEWAGHHACAQGTKFSDAWVSFALARKAWAYRADQLPSTHPVAGEVPDLAAVYLTFDGITYAKGAAIIKALVAWVGEDDFLRAIRNYFAKYAWGNTQLADLLAELEFASGRDLTSWAQAWLRTTGADTLRVICELDECGNYRAVAVAAEPSRAADGTPSSRPHRIRLAAYDWSAPAQDGRGQRLAAAGAWELDIAAEVTPVPSLVGRPAVALLLPNSGDLTYAKLRLDSASLRVGRASVAALPDPLDRALVWGCLWDMVRDGELAAVAYLDTVTSNLGGEPNLATVTAILRQLPQTVFCYAADSEGLPTWLAGVTRAWLAAAPAGGDLQLAFARGFVRWAQPGADVAQLRDWLQGRDLLPGLAMDADLKWEIVVRLAALGEGDPVIARALSADDTMSGQRWAAQARAAQPTKAAKQAAWAALTGPETELSNAVAEQIITGFNYPEHAAVTAAYADSYFAEIPQIWSARSPALAHALAEGLFPGGAVSQKTVDAALALARRSDVPASLRRILLDGADEVVRALRARRARPATLEPGRERG